MPVRLLMDNPASSGIGAGTGFRSELVGQLQTLPQRNNQHDRNLYA